MVKYALNWIGVSWEGELLFIALNLNLIISLNPGAGEGDASSLIFPFSNKLILSELILYGRALYSILFLKKVLLYY